MNIYSLNLKQRFFFLGVSLVVVAGFFASQAKADTTDTAQNGRLVTFHDRGETRVILTHAQTVRDALTDAHIPVVSQDTVEPSLDEQLVATDYTVNIYRARPVVVIDGAIRQKVMTSAQTPEGISAAAGIQLHDEDSTVLARSDNIVSDGAGDVLAIDRATEFTLKLYGTVMTAYSQEKTVGEMLLDKRIELGATDDLSVPLDAPLVQGMTVAIWRDGVQVTTVKEKIPFSVRQVEDFDHPVGYHQVQTQGVSGQRSVTYEVMMRDGKEFARKEIQSVVLSQPKEQVEIVGAKPSFSGDFAAALAKLRQCEAGGNYANKNNPLYRGAYQFGYTTWANKYGIYDPADASPAQQDQAARELYQRRGWQPWPNCGKSLPDIYR